MDGWETTDYLPLSGIQHYAFCPRQWALIHIEQQWEENIFTFRGQEMHQKANNPYVVEKRRDKIVARAVPIVSHSLGLYGVADVVEFERSERGVTLARRKGFWRPVPVEYKVGRPKSRNIDTLQLCAQALCLEEMFDITLDRGYIFYGATRRRLDVLLDAELRSETKDVAACMHQAFAAGITPAANYNAQCERCSLIQLCIPKLSESKKVSAYLRTAIDS
ncbi:MAG: CRISPR-associated protein Cas4 [Bacillota bacterium]|jgi:CRISPR-associated exonuclease Cas4|nr:CRISPR-associated protein Cas4 [Bacillota bacterium]